MKMLIKCAVCGKSLGEVSKPVITDDDKAKYEQMTRCDEHIEATPETVVEE